MKTASGMAGEDHICQWLKGQGYIIVARNYHSRYGEIDIIAQKGSYLAFVEVKPERKAAWCSLWKPLHRKSKKKLLATAKDYLAGTRGTTSPVLTQQRCICAGGGIVGEKYLENAFLDDLEGSTCIAILIYIAIHDRVRFKEHPPAQKFAPCGSRHRSGLGTLCPVLCGMAP